MRPRQRNTGHVSRARANNLILLLLALLCLTACAARPEEPILELPDIPAQPQGPADPEPGEKSSGWSCIAEQLYSLEISGLSGEIEQVFATDDRTLVFARSETGVTLWPFDLQTGLPVGNALELGDILWYSTETLADGTLPLVRSEGTPGQWETVLFLDPTAMTVQTMVLPNPGGHYGLHFSPDRQYAALSTFEGLEIRDGATMTQLLLAIPVVKDETQDHAERQTVWAEDWYSGTVLTARLAEPDLVKCPVIIDMADKSITYVTDLNLCQGRLLDDRTMLWYNYFKFAPAGTYDRVTGDRTELVFLDTLYADAMTCIALSDESVALSYLTTENGKPTDAWVSVMTLRRGYTVARTSLPLDGVYGAFEQLAFTPDGTTLLALYARDDQPGKNVIRLPLS